MALTREQTNKIKINPDVIVGFSGTGGDICAEQLAKWAYRRLETWPDLLDACKEFDKSFFKEGQIDMRKIGKARIKAQVAIANCEA